MWMLTCLIAANNLWKFKSGMSSISPSFQGKEGRICEEESQGGKQEVNASLAAAKES